MSTDRRTILRAILQTHRQYAGHVDDLDDLAVESQIDYWSGEAARTGRRVKAAQHLIASGQITARGLAAIEVSDLHRLLDGPTGKAS
jgi:hypothetical protein